MNKTPKKLSKENKNSTIDSEINLQNSPSSNSNTSNTMSTSNRKSNKRKRKFQSCIDSEATIDKSLEEKLEECAKRNNLTPLEIKKILKSVVGNDHVLALVKLQEDEENKKQRLMSSTSDNSSSSSKNGDHSDGYVPKLTRAKARALNKKPMPIVPLNEKEPEPEVAALISEELHSDEDDEEYYPKEEDFVSDDDQNTTMSDIDSQPATPATPPQHYNDSPETSKTYLTEDGVFKVPRQRYDSAGSHHQEEIIAKRTRSKLCLETTPIEAIESNFIPPDITTDMYDFDRELDQEWVEFLNEFSKPLNANNSVEEDEDEADPEYVAVDKEPIDAEELRDVNISKKELSDLITELFDGLVQDGVFVEDVPQAATTEICKKDSIVDEKNLEKSPQRKRQKLSTNVEEQLPTQKIHQTNNVQISTSNTYNTEEFNYEMTANNSVQNVIYFQPNMISTPQQQNPTVNLRQNQVLLNFQDQNEINHDQPSIVNSDQALLSPLQPLQPSSNVMTAISSWPMTNDIQTTYVTFPVLFPSNTSTKKEKKYIAIPMNLMSNLQLPSTDYRIVSTIDLTKSPTPQSSSPPLNPPKRPYHRLNKTIEKFRVFQDLKDHYAKEYEKLKDLHIEDENHFDENQIGFTDYQREIFDQQMRIHVQFCTQNFIQTYSHPELWKLAQPEKDMLLELENNCKSNTKSAFNALNLKPALELIRNWEAELSIQSKENRELMDFFYKEIDRIKSKNDTKIHIMRFPPRIMKLIVQSPVFMYPHLLPRIPFRCRTTFHHNEFCPSEDHIIAHAMDYYFKEIKENRPKTKMGDLRLVCDYISKNLLKWKTCRAIYVYVIFCRDKKSTYNPIKFYFDRGRAPPFNHKLYPIDLDCILSPQSKPSELPLVWKEFVTTLLEVELKRTCHRRVNINNLKQLNLNENNKNNNVQNDNQLTQLSNVCTINNNNNSNNDENAKKYIINFNYVFDNNLIKDTENLNKIINTTSTTNLFNNFNNNNNNLKTNINYIHFGQQQQQHQQQQESENDPIIQSNLVQQDNNNCDEDNLNLDNSSSIDNSSGNQSKLINHLLVFNENKNNLNELQQENEKENENDYTINNNNNSNEIQLLEINSVNNSITNSHKKLNYARKFCTISKSTKNSYLKNKKYKKFLTKLQYKKLIKNKIKNLINISKSYLNNIYNKYKNNSLNNIYIHFKSIELYTNLLHDLKMYCKKMKCIDDNITITNNCNNSNSPLGGGAGGKRTKLNDDELKMKKSIKANENLRQMLMTENNEDINKKDAIYAFNFYEKVEEAFKSKHNMENFRKFQNILKKFDPNKDRVAELYNKIENLLLPDHADLLQVFLTFLLPSQASEIGKFFEHFMLTNMTNFINKLNIYFNKQPSQVKKVYTILNELSDENDLTMDKIKLKILPLLKGNQFLIDWFLQMFPCEEPPKSLDTVSENINAKQLETHVSGYVPEYVSQKDLVPDSPDHQPCQIRYINGRIFYGSRIVLPAKLAFIAKDLTKHDEWHGNTHSSDNENHTSENEGDKDLDQENDERFTGNLKSSCVHPISAYAEKIIKNQSQNEKDSCNEGEKSEDEDGRGDNTIKYKICDDVAHKKHAARLNPSLYSSSSHYAIQTKLRLDISDRETSKSPKKQCIRSSNTMSPLSTGGTSIMGSPTMTEIASGQGGMTTLSVTTTNKEKRKSPTKKTLTKSPVSIKKHPPPPVFNSQSTIVPTNNNSTSIPEATVPTGTANAIKTAKKLKAIIEEDNQKKKTITARRNTLSPPLPLSATVQKSTECTSSLETDNNTRQSNVSNVSTTKINIPTTSQTSSEPKTNVNWTRDEDKIILEEAKIGFDSEENLTNRLKLKLTNRTIDEIVLRYRFLMDVLSQLQNRN